MLKIGELFNDEEIIRMSEKENVIITKTYNKASCTTESNFYHMDTQKHWFTKAS